MCLSEIIMSSITIRDVAKRAGVGVGTVSRVINKSTAVSAQTRQKVLSAIKELNYRPNTFARRLSLGKTLTVAVIVAHFSNPSVVERLRGVERALSQSHYDMVLFNVETIERRDACLEEITRRERVDGILIISILLEDLDVERFLQSGVPVVLIDAMHPHLNYVMIDDYEGGYLATQHLIELGHTKISYLADGTNDPFNFSPPSSRYEGYTQALKDAGISYNEQYVEECDLDRVSAKEAALKLLTQPDPPTAIFTYCDTQACGVLEATRDLGVRVPEDVSVVGYDDIEIAQYFQLTTINQSLFLSGWRGGKMLLEVMANERPLLHQEYLSPKLIVRETSATLYT